MRLKLSQIITIISIVTTLYIVFQFFIFNKLNNYNIKQTAGVTQSIENAKKVTQNVNMRLDTDEIEKYNNNIPLLNQTINILFHYQFLKQHNEILTDEINLDKNNKIIKGVNRKRLNSYQPDSLGQFKCIKSKVKIDLVI